MFVFIAAGLRVRVHIQARAKRGGAAVGLVAVETTTDAFVRAL